VHAIAIFASGSGTNAENLIRYFISHPQISVRLVLSNKADAFVLERARKLDVPSLVFNKSQFYESNYVIDQLHHCQVEYIILAGFLWLVPGVLLNAYPERIVNIHPALLPAHGGKGMYGMKVHQEVIDQGDKESGITIHYLNEQYDRGTIIFQARCEVIKDDTAEELAARVHQLEYKYFPPVVESVILGTALPTH
jgi:phosphoribosylglycinamide formyltransferase-1